MLVERALCLGRSCNCLSRRSKRNEEGVALRVHFVAVVAGEDIAKKAAIHADLIRIAIAPEAP